MCENRAMASARFSPVERAHPLRIPIVALLSLALLGCANFRRLKGDLKEIEKTSELSGKVRAGEWMGGPIDVFLFEADPASGKPRRVAQFETLEKPGKYSFRVHPGSYMIGAAEDVNLNTTLDPGEPHGLYEDFELIEVGPKESHSRLNLTLSKARAPALDRLAVEEVEIDFDLRIGEIAALDSPQFDPSSGPLGMWQPFEFFEKYGAGVYMLQEYDPGKIPVLFIHGMSGHPREFSTLIDSLDPSLYQPWVYQYPSGLRIEKVARGLERILKSMRAKQKFDRVCVVAHSMGGLLAHRWLRDQADAGGDRYVRFLATISSPLGGIASADTGVKMAPEVVPSWRDVGPKSEFIRTLFDRPFPDDIEYALYFGFGSSGKKSKQGTDGTVLVRNALPRAAQDSATVVSGFAETHTGILSNEATVEQLNKDLTALCRPQ